MRGARTPTHAHTPNLQVEGCNITSSPFYTRLLLLKYQRLKFFFTWIKIFEALTLLVLKKKKNQIHSLFQVFQLKMISLKIIWSMNLFTNLNWQFWKKINWHSNENSKWQKKAQHRNIWINKRFSANNNNNNEKKKLNILSSATWNSYFHARVGGTNYLTGQ